MRRERARGEDDIGLKLGRRRVAMSFGEAGSFGGAAEPRRRGRASRELSHLEFSHASEDLHLGLAPLTFGHASIIFYEGKIR